MSSEEKNACFTHQQQQLSLVIKILLKAHSSTYLKTIFNVTFKAQGRHLLVQKSTIVFIQLFKVYY